MKKTFILCIVILQFALLQGQNTPLSIAQLVFSTKMPKDISMYATGEYARDGNRPNGKDFNKHIERSLSVLEENDSSAIVNITLIISENMTHDAYLYFVKKDSTWKISAYRALAQTTNIQNTLQQLENLSPQQLEDLIKAGDMFKSQQEFELYKKNLQLTIAGDNQLISHFYTHISQFDAIKDSILVHKAADTTQQIKYEAFLKPQMTELGLTFIKNIDENCLVCFNAQIGGLGDNTVGYLYIPDERFLPKMSENQFIMIKPLSKGWYLYKTT